MSEVDEGEAEMVGIGIDGICQLLSSDMTDDSHQWRAAAS